MSTFVLFSDMTENPQCIYNLNVPCGVFTLSLRSNKCIEYIFFHITNLQSQLYFWNILQCLYPCLLACSLLCLPIVAALLHFVSHYCHQLSISGIA